MVRSASIDAHWGYLCRANGCKFTNSIRLPELIATTPEAYEQMAIDLAVHPEKLAAIKHKLAENRLATPLFDTKLFTKHIEAAYTKMYQRYQAGWHPIGLLSRTEEAGWLRSEMKADQESGGVG